MQSVKERWEVPVPHDVVRTSGGFAHQDQSGLWHFTNERPGPVEHAITDALYHKDLRPAWFWFNEVPCPIIEGDTVESLTKRWMVWRDVWEPLVRVLRPEKSPFVLLKRMMGNLL